MNWGKIAMWTTFMIIMLFVALSVAGLITIRCTPDMSGWGRVFFACIITLIFMSPFLWRIQNPFQEFRFYHIATYVAYFLFVCVFLFFCLMIARDVIWIPAKWIFPQIPSPFHSAVLFKANISLLLLVIALAGYSLYEGMRIPTVKNVTLYSDKLDRPLTIASLPDIHIHGSLSSLKLKGIVERTNALEPDIIALPGDIIDDRTEAIMDLLPFLSEFHAPLGVFVVDGNHEIYMGPQSTQPLFEAENLIYLYNTSQEVRPDVRIAGVPDIQSARIGRPPDMKKALPQEKQYTILLAHTPKMFDMPGNTADLQLSGHTHGGQIFPFQLFAWLSNRYLSGLFQRGNRTLYVSRGAGQWGPQMRLLAPAEITFITVLPNFVKNHHNSLAKRKKRI